MKGITMQHTYSYLGSPLHLVLEDEIADGYNRFHDAFMEAQFEYMERTHLEWAPDQPLNLRATKEDMESYDKVGRVINLLVEINGGGLEIPEDQCTSDHLIRV